MRRWVLMLCLLCLVPGAHAEEQPLWELGLGVSGLAFPAYRGSDRYYDYVLPLPYLVYRGDHLRVDKEGLRGVLFDSDRVALDLSLSAAVPVRSGDLPERDGMPDLDPVFELGPLLNIELSEDGANASWEIKLPVRGVFSVGDGIEHVGWLFHPKLNFSASDFIGAWNFGFNVGPIFADHRYHDYYYGVDPGYASATREAYRGQAGYSGTAVLASLSRRYKNYWIGAFMRYDNLSGSRFEDSPLVVSEHALMAGVGITWVFRRSAQMVAEAE